MVAWLCFAGFHVIVFMFEGLPLGVHQWDLTTRKAIEHARVRLEVSITSSSLFDPFTKPQKPLH